MHTNRGEALGVTGAAAGAAPRTGATAASAQAARNLYGPMKYALGLAQIKEMG